VTREKDGICCLVTIHGVGFMQPPEGTTPGYADPFHDHLASQLGDLLSGDPDRQGLLKPIYVRSDWPPVQPVPLKGLDRLGTIDPVKPWEVHLGGGDVTTDLVIGSAPIAHVALVYTGLQERGADPEATLHTLGLALSQLTQYTTVGGLAGMLVDDVKAYLSGAAGHSSSSPSLRVRSDSAAASGTGPVPDPGSPQTIIRQVEDDVAGYVSRNDARERVRDFVWGALARLAMRPDVGSIVVNAHSQGTVAAYDALRRLAPAAQKLTAFVTAGCPLRKYVTLFSWGSEVANVARAAQWMNFWDADDPVADPLRPPANWRRGDPVPEPPGPDSLMNVLNDSGVLKPILIEDVKVDNVKHTDGAGLAVHNYWDNLEEFVAPLTGILRHACGQGS
jgi:hypothetical protein